MTTIGLTGATGAVGGMTARNLARDAGADMRLRLFARDTSRLPRIDGAEQVPLAYGDTDAKLEEAFRGLDALLFVSGREAADRMHGHRAVVRAARKTGVAHIVYTSFVGAAPDAEFTLARDHGATEEAIRAAGIPFTFLRDNFYLDLLPLYAGADGVIRGPAGDGRVAAVARADIADVAAAVLSDPQLHENATYNMTGGEALTLAEVATRASAVLGRTISFHNETPDEAYASRRATYPDAADWQLDAWVSTYTAIARGLLADVSGDVLAVTGHAPRRLEDALGA